MEIERIYRPFEVKSVENGSKIKGYGSVFGNVDAYGEIIAPGAFTASLKAHAQRGTSPVMLWQHNPDWPIGKWLKMAEDERGLAVEGDLADTTLARDVGALVRMGAIDGASIGFVTKKAEMDEKTGVRTLTEVELWEVSLVTFPANYAARIEARKAKIEECKIRTEFEKILRNAGFSRSESKALISGVLDLAERRNDALIEVKARELMREWQAKAIRERIFGKSQQ